MSNKTAYESNMTEQQAEDLVELKQVEAALLKKFEGIENLFDKVTEEIKVAGSASNDAKAEIEKLSGDYNDLYDRVQQLEQKGVSSFEESKHFDLGEEFTKSEAFKDLQDGRTSRGRMEVKTAIINATGQNQPLVAADRLAGFNTTPNRILTIRDILPASGTTSNLVEFVRENVFTNNAGPQISGSPEAYENVTKPESGITFTLATAAVITLAHFIPASKQVLDDSPSLQSFINGRLMYGLKLKEETQLLSGTGANHQLNGLISQATSYSLRSPNLTNEIDIIRDAQRQAQVSEYMPDAVILNPSDWYDIDVRKVGASDDRYVVGNPRSMSAPMLWGMPVVITNSISSGTFLLGNFQMGAEIKDREQSSVELSLEDSTNFQKNMVTIRAEERLTLCVYRTEAFITGSL